MKSTTIVSQKGGVGKTTLALNLSFSLSNLGYRTLLVDADPQGAIGYSLLGHEPGGGLQAAIEHQEDPRSLLLTTRVPEFCILPVGAVPPERSHAFCGLLEDGSRLRDLLSALEGDFDAVFVDTPSGFTGATLGALRSCDAALSPLHAEPIGMRTLPQLLGALGALRESGPTAQLVGLVLCMLQQRNGDSLAVAEEAWSRLPNDLVLETTIPRDPTALAASSAGVPVGLMSRARPPALALVFDQLALEAAPRIGLDAKEDDGPLTLFA